MMWWNAHCVCVCVCVCVRGVCMSEVENAVKYYVDTFSFFKLTLCWYVFMFVYNSQCVLVIFFGCVIQLGLVLEWGCMCVLMYACVSVCVCVCMCVSVCVCICV